MDDLLAEFLAESADNLTRLDRDMIELERDPTNSELLNSAFRTIHTIKGTCGFLDLSRLERVSHTSESVLDMLRSERLTAGPDVVSDILTSIDTIKAILVGLEQTGCEPPGDDSDIVASLEAWLDESVPCSARPTDGEPDTSARAISSPTRPTDAGHPNLAPQSAPETIRGASSIRINVDVLDSLMTLAGELVLARNQLSQLAGRDEQSEYVVPVQQLDRITAELQGAVMRTRMQPVGAAWSKLPRLVREVARDTGKQIQLDMKGADTELDRQLVQALQDPLMHMVRNSADHGIEQPDVRRASGKSEFGTIRVRAFHEGGQVIVEITDDGAGIDPAVVRRKAIQRGLVRAEIANAMDDRQIFRFLFEPGFSTAEFVTHLSGRGVGMDVVRDNVTRVGGTVELRSTTGHGCTVRIKLPLTLAIVPALLVSVEEEVFAFPQSCVLELVRVPADRRLAFESLQGVPLYRLRDSLIPVIGLRGLLDLPHTRITEATTLVICQTAGSRFGVVVDDVIDTQEIVIKPVSRRVRHVACYAGCTILGDGRVIMILDPVGIATMSGTLAPDVSPGDSTADDLSDAVPMDTVQRDSILLFQGGTAGVQAVLLSQVARLEEIATERLEAIGDRFVVQYRGSLLPIVSAMPSQKAPSAKCQSVIVFNEGNTSFGIAVQSIQDIVEDSVRLELGPSRPGVLGTAVIAGRATELIDVSYYMEQAHMRPGAPV